MLRLQARQPGSREHLRVSVDYDRVERTPDKFNLVIQRVSRAGSQLVDDQEVFDGLVDGSDRRALHRRRPARTPSSCGSSGPAELSARRRRVASSPGQPIPYITRQASRLRRRRPHRLRRHRLERRGHRLVRARSLRASRSPLRTFAAGTRPRQHELPRRDALLRAAARAARLGSALGVDERGLGRARRCALRLTRAGTR